MKKILSLLLSVALVLVTLMPNLVYAANLRDATYNISQSEIVYNGAEFKPTLDVFVDQTVGDVTTQVQLVEGVDYELLYSSNIKVGYGSVVIRGKGDYDQKQKTIKLTILPPAVTGLKVTGTTNSSVSLKWDAISADSGISGYIVYSCDKNGGNQKKVASTKDSTVTVKNLGLASKYNFVVVAYKTINNDTKLYGDSSNIVNTCTKPNKVVLSAVTCAKNKKSIKVAWGHKNGSGYEIKYSTNINFKNAKSILVKNEKTLSKTINVATTDKTYYVKVRAFKLDSNGKYNYGEWSEPLSNRYSKVYSKYSSYYVNNKDRTTNLKLACSKIDGTILQPGQTFSFNATVGKRTAAKGFKPAHVFAGSTETVMGVGGGVCQVASTMFNAALLGNFQIVERHQHSQRVAYVPLGRDAAIYWGAQDFKFKNNTNRPVKIKMACKDGKVSCTLLVSEDVKPKKVSLSVSQSGNKFTLKRNAGGKTNYTTSSRY